MEEKRKKAAVLGSTGSVGTQALEALAGIADFVLLTGGSNVSLLAKQARLYRAECCAVSSESAARELRLLLAGEDIRVVGGKGAIEEEILKCGADVIFHAIAGMAGIPSALAASVTGARLAIANKESIISVGNIIFDNIKKHGGELIPVDSEHSAIFQCLTASGAVTPRGAERPEIIKRILLTASGGPFYGMTRDELSDVTPEMALSHPTWKMGKKITIDSATLMNKGFEIIEAARLFGVDDSKIEVLIHRQSIIHSMVEYIDTTVMAQMGTPDMRHCVRYALSYPERMSVSEAGLDFSAIGALTFDSPDTDTFSLLNTARRAYEMGTTAPAALIAADEAAVEAFIASKLSFNGISDVVSESLERYAPSTELTLESVLDAEAVGRSIALETINIRRSKAFERV